MKVQIPPKLPSDPAKAYRLGFNAGAKSAPKSNGAKGGAARASKLTPERRREIARNAARGRWATVDPTGTGSEMTIFIPPPKS